MSSAKFNFNFTATKRFTSWQPILIFSFLYIFANGFGLYGEKDGTPDHLHYFRIFHILMCIGATVFIGVKKDQWKSSYGLPLFLPIILSGFILTWLYIDAHLSSGQLFSPFNIIRIHFFVLAFLVPSSYWINFSLMIGFALQATYMWFSYDLPHLSNAAMGGEPFGLIIAFGVSLTIFFFRYRDEQIIRALITKEARSEVVQQIARTFLTIRDKSNTPLQTLILSAALLKKKYPEDMALINVVESNIERLKDTNQILTSLEHRIAWQGEELLSDDEILKWLAGFKETNLDNNP